jgi:hypothetical protein
MYSRDRALVAPRLSRSLLRSQHHHPLHTEATHGKRRNCNADINEIAVMMRASSTHDCEDLHPHHLVPRILSVSCCVMDPWRNIKNATGHRQYRRCCPGGGDHRKQRSPCHSHCSCCCSQRLTNSCVCHGCSTMLCRQPLAVSVPATAQSQLCSPLLQLLQLLLACVHLGKASFVQLARVHPSCTVTTVGGTGSRNKRGTAWRQGCATRHQWVGA